MTVLVLDGFRVLVRWLHLVAAVAWVGGSILYLLALVPASREIGGEAIRAALAGTDRRFRELTQLSIAVLIVTGAVITFDRLQLQPGPNYVVTLGIKVALAVWMFVLAQDLASRGRRRLIERRTGVKSAPSRSPSTTLILALGLVVLLLSDVLKVIGPA
ncbi:MAG: hypothetical protein KGJ86_21930 [Chloroflexota bacterium]|nr:hypothetical protein [Chloroflexota bacterium]